MIKALLLIFDPISSWERVVEAKRSIVFILLVYLLPLLLITSAVEIYGLVHWGKQYGEFGRPVTVTMSAALTYGGVQFGLNLLTIFLGAYIIKAVGETFHGRHSYTSAFTCVAYSMSPLFTVRMLDALPQLLWWLAWPVGIAISLGVLYQGIPRVMQPDPAHAMGLYFIGALLLLMITGLARVMGHFVLEKQMHTALLLPAHAAFAWLS